jgi:hypothetical protein
MRKVKLLVATLAMTLLVASPAFAAVVFDADAGFLTETSLEGSGFDLEIAGFRGD